MQSDGNLVVYSPSNQAMWSTGTAGSNATGFEMQDDGNLVLYTFRWSAGTYAWPPPPGPFPAADCSIGINLNALQTLPSGKCITSPKRQYLLYMPPDGNLFIYDIAHNVGTWGAGTGGHSGAYAVMQADGNFVVYTADGQQALWSSGTNGTNAERLEMSDDGRMIIYRSVWNSGTSQGVSTQMLAHPGCDLGTGMGQGGWLGTGQCFVSFNGRYELLMQTDGNLVINDLSVNPAQTLWSANTGLTPLSPGVAMQTLYTYDALGNLTCVEQHGGVTGTGCSASPSSDPTSPWRVRRFTYDSFSRLLTATNPESGAISYFYDTNGNLLQKVLPAPNQTGAATHTISYCYDALNRVTGKAYSWQNCQNGQLPQGTAVVSYTYDQGTNGIGHLTNLTDQAGSASYSYDILGRMVSEQRTIAGVTKNMSYTYNLDGSAATVKYPSGATITYTPDSAGRMLSAVDKDNNINYVTGATYGPHNALTGFVSGQRSGFNGITNTTVYDVRLQPCRMTASSLGAVPTNCDNSWGELMDLRYDFHLGNGDNGNVYGITHYGHQTRNQTFTYDALNRLTSAQNAGTDCTMILPDGHTEYWGNSYSYDAWGNLLGKTPTKCSAENLSVGAAANNQLQGGYAYDAAGNMMRDNNGTSYSYDAENRIAGAAGFTYTYDADGNRVEKSNGRTTPPTGTLYWYMSLGIVGESDLAGNLKSEYVFFDGERVARKDFPGNAVSHYLSDHLKTASVITDSAGNIKSESDYYPWGGELQFTNNDSNHYKFTGKERDSETGLDYFGARYYGNALGRFITPDWSAVPVPVPYADLTDPQSLNQYSYVRNLPTTRVDVDGHDGCCSLSDVWDFVRGAANAYGSDNFGGAGRMDGGSLGYRLGQVVGGGAAVIQGASETGAGVVGEVGGIALDGTGAGAVVGIPVNIVSAGVIAHGATTTAVAGVHLGKALVSAFSGNHDSPPNPHGSEGAPDHQVKVGELVNKAKSEAKAGETVESNKQVKGLDSTRRPDAQIINAKGKTRKVFEAERRPNSGRNKNREAEYKKLKLDNETHPLK
jgi:RHS repeat-associated protein